MQLEENKIINKLKKLRSDSFVKVPPTKGNMELIIDIGCHIYLLLFIGYMFCTCESCYSA